MARFRILVEVEVVASGPIGAMTRVAALARRVELLDPQLLGVTPLGSVLDEAGEQIAAL